MIKYHLHNRPNRELKQESDISTILKNGKFVVISMCRDNEPYIVTLSYGYDLERKSLYFHCAQKGLKLDFLSSNKKVCATVIEDGGYITGECGHEYKSVVFWGDMQIVNDLDEKKHGMSILLHHLEDKDSVIKEKLLKSEDYYSKMEILRLDIKQIHGKAGR
jgi:nitroimidazol reductase NimA-like FMN-containing flavoprotein (pyridoxamine 5'-phosphate oxidase superfamily)